MAKLSKDPKLQFRVPPWASFFTPGEYADFLQLVTSDIRRKGLTAHIDDGAVIVKRSDRPPEKMNLLNLAQTCRGSPRGEWAPIIAQFFDHLLKNNLDAKTLLAKLEDFAGVRGALKVRLHPESYLESPHAGHLVLKKIADGIAALLVCDLGFANMSVPNTLPAQWGKSVEELFDLAVQNVRAEGRLEETKGPRIDGFSVDILGSGSNYAASRILAFEDYSEKGTGYGAIVAVPNRHLIFRHVIRDANLLHAVRVMLTTAAEAYKQGPGSISDRLYWWRPGKLELLPATLSDNALVFNPGEEFKRDVIQSMMKGD